MALAQEHHVLDRQQARLRRFLRDHAIEPSAPLDLARAEHELVLELKQVGSLRASQSTWLAYRNAWLRLVRALHASGSGPELREIDVRTVLTRERCEELEAE